MRIVGRKLLVLALISGMCGLRSVAAADAAVGADTEWPSVNADSDETGFSRLEQIIVWRFYVVPASPEMNRGDPAREAAAKTWNGEFWKKTGGGGGSWDNITFDAEFKRLYISFANTAPYDAEARSPGGGDNLYTVSIVVLDADTGKYVWHYQINPRDTWGYDCTSR